MAKPRGKGPRNWFAIWVSAAVVVALVVVVIVVVAMNGSSGGSGAVPEGSAIDSETGAIVIGDGPDTVTTWVDFYCPHCQEFEATYGPTLTDLVDEGSITLEVHPVALSSLNTASGTDFSARSAGAMYCVAIDNPDASLAFLTSVFQTEPSGEGLTDDELVAHAEAAGALGAADCIRDETYADYALDQAANLPENPSTGSAGTPTLLVNDEYVAVTGDVQADVLNRLMG